MVFLDYHKILGRYEGRSAAGIGFIFLFSSPISYTISKIS